MTLWSRATLAVALSLLAAWTMTARNHPFIIHNRSPSAPVGFYLRAERPARLGDFVTLPVPASARAYASSRAFGDESDRFLKRVAAVAGQTVCASGELVTIDGTHAVQRASLDATRRPLPTWEGCRQLAQDEVFLLGATQDSFDGRYWGVSSRHEIAGVWRPLCGDVSAPMAQ